MLRFSRPAWLKPNFLLLMLVVLAVSSNIRADALKAGPTILPLASILGSPLQQNASCNGQPANNCKEFTDFTFYIDPGHGGLPSEQDNPPCQYFGAIGPEPYRTYEKTWTLQIGLALGDMLYQHGAAVYYTRTTDVEVCNADRRNRNNQRYQNTLGASPSNYRFISLHMNQNVNIQNIDQTEVYYYDPNDVSHDGLPSLASEMAHRIGVLVNASTPRQKPLEYTSADVVPQLDGSLPEGRNVLVESNYLSYNAAFQDRLRAEAQFVYRLAKAHYFALLEFFIVGFEAAHHNQHQAIADKYSSLLDADAQLSTIASPNPGVPFNNG